jgi:hypothetical protein
MPEQMMQWILGGAVAALWWFFRDRMKTMEENIKENAEKVEQIKTNYLDRFQDLRDLVTAGHEDIKDSIASLREDLAKNYITKTDCNDFLNRKHE